MTKLVVSVEKMPEVIYAIRNEMAALLEKEADAETNSSMQHRLRQIASIFRIGNKEP